jgi:ClpP class serine protease
LAKRKVSEDDVVEESAAISLGDLFSSIVSGYKADGTEDDKKIAKNNIKQYLKQVVEKTELSSKFNIAVLYDSSTMVKSDADSIYNAVTQFSNDRPILLILYSNGGVIGSAYLIGQLCREHSKEKFVITVPRQAKSAATLLCCAADEIHMGSLSELGPIDPQINGLPALGLKNSIQHIANLVKETPESAEMFARYLHYSVRPIDLGYYERVAESAMQYAEKLLESNSKKLPKAASAIAHDLVYTYKDHGFVLDKNESIKIFGSEIVKINTEEYQFSNSVYNELSMIEKFFGYFDYNFYLIGSLESDPTISKKRAV